MEENLRLLSAAIAARDGLRSVVLPGLDQLAQRATHLETVTLIETLRGAALSHVDGLRAALKDREARPRNSAAHQPCWARTR